MLQRYKICANVPTTIKKKKQRTEILPPPLNFKPLNFETLKPLNVKLLHFFVLYTIFTIFAAIIEKQPTKNIFLPME